MQKKPFWSLILLALFSISVLFLGNFTNSSHDGLRRPLSEREEEDDNPDKFSVWDSAQAANHMKNMAKYMPKPNSSRSRGIEAFAGGALQGSWSNRGPYNMPGAFKFADMLDGTDTIYAVTWNHYSGEYNSKSYIFRGTVFNPATGVGGDDFERLTGHWPNRYKDMQVFKVGGVTRILVGIENGGVYYSDDQGTTFNLSQGLPSSLKSTCVNRQESNRVYTTDGTTVYSSTDGGATFTTLQNFGTSATSFLYTPRYAVQQDAAKVYLVRNGSFYTLNGASFTLNGTTGAGTGSNHLSIGGDSRKLYVTQGGSYWSSTNSGTSWTQRYPHGNYYGDVSGEMSAGDFLAAHPENPDTVIGGYVHPIYSHDGLVSVMTDDSGWGGYQNGLTTDTSTYFDRIRFNYHPDFQSSHFFYNAHDSLLSVRCTDGGVFISYKEWTDPPVDRIDKVGANAHFRNITTLGTVCPLIYRSNMFTGYLNDDDINYSTQDQGSGCRISGTDGKSIKVWQSIGGDGPPISGVGGQYVWKWQREGGQVWGPVAIYNGTTVKTIGSMNGEFGSQPTTTFTKNSSVGWVQAYFDHEKPDTTMWLLSRRLDRAEIQSNGWELKATSTVAGTNQVAAMAQAWLTPDKVWYLQDSRVFKSVNRGDSFDGGTNTPLTQTSSNQNMGSGWVLPTNDDWILFTSPSANSVGSILSKDGGATWVDVTGSYPVGNDAQSSGMVGTPDGQFVFCGTDVGPWVFVVDEETWYPLGQSADAAYFNSMAVEYLPNSKTVRFGTWGSGIWDFVIDDGTPSLRLFNPGSAFKTDDTMTITWETNLTGTALIELLKGGLVVSTLTSVDATAGTYDWTIPSSIDIGSDYSLKITIGTTTAASSDIKIVPLVVLVDQTHLSVDTVDSEHSIDRLATTTIDGDSATFWHTEWSPNVPDFPHFITYALDATKDVAAFGYLPRPGGGNGTVATAQIRVSMDGTNWTTLFDGTVQGDTIYLDSSAQANYVQFYALTEVGGNAFASMAEFNVYSLKDVVTPASYSNADRRGSSIQVVGLTARTMHLSLSEAGSYSIRMVRLDGRVIYNKKMQLQSGANNLILPQNMSQGIAIVTIEGESNRLVQKISLK